MGRMDVVVLVLIAVVYHIAWTSARTGPQKHVRRLMGRAERLIKSPHLMGRGPARPLHFGSFTAWPGPSSFQNSRPGPTRPITFSEYTARPGPAHHNFQIGPARPGPPAHNKALVSILFVYLLCRVGCRVCRKKTIAACMYEYSLSGRYSIESLGLIVRQRYDNIVPKLFR